MARWRFHPPLWAMLGIVPACAALVALGSWQLHRGAAKQALLARYTAAAAQAPAPLDLRRPAALAVVRAAVDGTYDSARQLLLDNQSHQQRPGYQVWTPLRLASGELVLVNRGWIALPPSRGQLPVLTAPAGMQHLTGYWRALPEPGLWLAAPPCRPAQGFPVIVNYPRVAEVSCLLGETVAAGELLLDSQADGGFVREWNFDNGFPPERHYGYAFQWFALAATLFALFIKLNLKRAHD